MSSAFGLGVQVCWSVSDHLAGHSFFCSVASYPPQWYKASYQSGPANLFAFLSWRKYFFLIALETDFNVAETLNGSVSGTAINVAFMAAENTQSLFAPPSRSKHASKWCVKNAVLFLHTVVLISVNILLPTKNPMPLKMKESHEKCFAHIRWAVQNILLILPIRRNKPTLLGPQCNSDEMC